MHALPFGRAEHPPLMVISLLPPSTHDLYYSRSSTNRFETTPAAGVRLTVNIESYKGVVANIGTPSRVSETLAGPAKHS